MGRPFQIENNYSKNIEDVNVDKEGNLFVVDYDNRKILQFNQNWTLLFSFWGNYEREKSKIIRLFGNLLWNNQSIQKVGPGGNFIIKWIRMGKEKPNFAKYMHLL